LGVQGAIVRTAPAAGSDTTDSYGIYTMLAVSEGTYKVIVESATYPPDTAEVHVVAGKTTVHTLSLLAAFPRTGLLLSLPMNGSVVDQSGAQRVVTAHGGTFTTDRKGIPGAALLLNGTTEYLDLGVDAALYPRQGITLALWVNRTGHQGSTAITRWETVQHLTDERAFDLSIGGSDYFSWGTSRDGTQGTARTSRTAPGSALLNTWYFLTATWDGAMMKLYVGGVVMDSVAQSGMASSPNVRTGIGAVLGRSGDPLLAPFLGMIDDVKIYDRALTIDEIYRLLVE
jgi:hypothetical protein